MSAAWLQKFSLIITAVWPRHIFIVPLSRHESFTGQFYSVAFVHTLHLEPKLLPSCTQLSKREELVLEKPDFARMSHAKGTISQSMGVRRMMVAPYFGYFLYAMKGTLSSVSFSFFALMNSHGKQIILILNVVIVCSWKHPISQAINTSMRIEKSINPCYFLNFSHLFVPIETFPRLRARPLPHIILHR